MNAHTPTSDMVNQLKSLTIDGADRAPMQAASSSSRGKKFPWKAMVLTGMVAALGASAWYNDVDPTAIYNDIFAQTEAVVEAPVVTATAAPVQLDIARPAVVVPVVAPSVVGSGYVLADRETSVTPDVSGRLIALHVAIGDAVQQGDVIAVLNSDAAAADLRIMQANFAMAQARETVAVAALAQARADVEMKTTLAERGNLAPVAVNEARLTVQRLEGDLAVAQQATAIADLDVAKQQDILDLHVVTAPFSGVVIARNLNEGDIATSGLQGETAGIVTLIDPTALTVEVDVAENNLSSLSVGQKALVSLDAWPNQSFEAQVITIAPKASIQRGTVQVRLSFETPPLGVFANMAAKVTFTAPLSTTENL